MRILFESIGNGPMAPYAFHARTTCASAQSADLHLCKTRYSSALSRSGRIHKRSPVRAPSVGDIEWFCESIVNAFDTSYPAVSVANDEASAVAPIGLSADSVAVMGSASNKQPC